MSGESEMGEMLRRVYAMDRESCMAALRQIKRPRLDFTEEYLQSLSAERLRHVLAAAYLQAAKSRSKC